MIVMRQRLIGECLLHECWADLQSESQLSAYSLIRLPPQLKLATHLGHSMFSPTVAQAPATLAVQVTLTAAISVTAAEPGIYGEHALQGISGCASDNIKLFREYQAKCAPLSLTTKARAAKVGVSKAV